MKTQVQAHCRVFDALADSQRGGHDVIIRALDIFEAAATAFKSVTSQQASTEDHHNSSVLPTIAQGQLGLSMGSPDAGGGNDEGRRAYLRAEKGLALAREQLVKNAETLALMAQELEGAKRCICSFYESHSAATAQERKHTRAHASLCALDRGDLGCCMSPVDVTRAMGGLLRMHESEFEMQESIVCSVGYDTPAEVFMAYRAALDLRPFMNDRFLEELREIRQLSQELETASADEHSEQAAAGQ